MQPPIRMLVLSFPRPKKSHKLTKKEQRNREIHNTVEDLFKERSEKIGKFPTF